MEDEAKDKAPSQAADPPLSERTHAASDEDFAAPELIGFVKALARDLAKVDSAKLQIVGRESPLSSEASSKGDEHQACHRKPHRGK